MSFFKQLFATPKNPYIPGWDQIDPMEVEFSGCKLRLDLPPRSDPDFKDILNNNLNIYQDIVEDTSDLPWYMQDKIYRTTLIRRSLILKGKPWRQNELSAIDITVRICKINDFPQSMSCFNPTHFLQVIDKDNFFCYGPNSSEDLLPSFYSVCRNWKLLTINNSNWIFSESFWNYKEDEVQVPNRSTLITPIDDMYYLFVNFRIPGTYKPVEDCLCTYQNILDTLITRIHLTLSPSLAEKQANILRECGNTYPEKRKPISWEPFYIEGWHKDISQKDGEKLLPYPIPQYDPNLKPE